jgi:hypoxanthine phosphoribosyltransferase
MKYGGFLVILQKISAFSIMGIVKIKDKSFKVSIPEAEIKSRVKAVAEQINKDLAGKNPLFLCVLNGSFIFAADLYREITIPSNISFVKLASYQGTISTGKVQEVIGLNEDISGRTIVIVEDIVDTGRTMRQMIESLGTRNPESVHICALFVKPDKLEEPIDVEYAAFSIPDDFIVGYGLDYDQDGRGLKDVYTIVNDNG